MKNLYVVMISLLFIPALALADMCSTIAASYDQQIISLHTQTQTAVSLTSDPAEQEALLASYDLQKSQLEAERDSLLASYGCATDLIGDNPNQDGNDTTVDNPGDSGTDQDTVVNNPGDNSNNDDVVSQPEGLGCQEKLMAYHLSLGGGRDAQTMNAVRRHAVKDLRCNPGLYTASVVLSDHHNSHVRGKHESRPIGGGNPALENDPSLPDIVNAASRPHPRGKTRGRK